MGAQYGYGALRKGPHTGLLPHQRRLVWLSGRREEVRIRIVLHDRFRSGLPQQERRLGEWNRHRGIKDHENRAKSLNIVCCLGPFSAQIRKTCEAVGPFSAQFEGPTQEGYFAGSLSNEIAVARTTVMTRSSPAFR